MKKGDSFELSSAWWKKEGAVTLPKSGLGKALKAYEAAKAKFDSANNTDGTKLLTAFVAAKDALEEVDKARKNAIGLCKELIHKETKEALQKDDVIGQEEKRLLLGITKELIGPIQKAEEALKKLVKEVPIMEGLLKEDREAKKKGKATSNSLDFQSSYARAYSARNDISGVVDAMPKLGPLKTHVPSIASRLDAVMKENQKANLQDMYFEGDKLYPNIKLKEWA